MITGKILVVDDEESVCHSIGKILTRRGFEVDSSANVEDAMKKMNQTSFDLVVTDLMMPKTSGMELLQIIRDNYPELDVVMITGYASIESAVEATKLGAAGYLPKPFTPDELMKVMDKTFEARRNRPPVARRAVPAPKTQVTSEDVIDVDMPFSEQEVEKATSPAYVESLTHSDIPVAKKKAADKAYCMTGQRECRRLVTEGRECVGECPVLKKERERAAKAIGRAARPNADLIDVDMPFPIGEVERIVGADYINCMERSDVPRAALYGRDATARHSVLVIDDEPIVCHSVRRILSRQRCAVEEAFDVDAALQKMKLNRYDLVILDLKMPKRSGMEVLEAIRANYPNVPVVMVSGFASIDTAIEATRMGASNFIAKPFTPGELVKAAEEVLAA